MPAQATANNVMASEKRLIDVRQSCLSNSKNRGDQRTGVADTDPPHEIDDGESPGDGDDDAPDANALVKQPGGGDQQQLEQREARGEREEPLLRRFPERLSK